MSEESLVDDQSQSHYEISLTAGQAFIAFVLLLLSLAASFAFGLMIGKGQADERLVVRKEPAVINEASALPKKSEGKIVELGVESDDFKAKTDSTVTSTASPASDTAVVTEGTANTTTTAAEVKPAVTPTPEPAPAAAPVVTPAAAPHKEPVAGPVEAQLASIGDQKSAEALAAKLINKGFTSAYVERGANDKGTVWRVRVKFPSEAEANAALPRLKEFSKDIWITH